MRIRKAWYKSKTILVNIAAAIPPAVVLLLPLLEMDEVRALIPEDWYKFYAIILTLGNIYLRAITSESVGTADTWQDPDDPKHL